MGSRIVGLVVPEAAGVIPTEAAVMYPNLTFVAHGIGLQSLSPAGYDEAIERVIPAAQWLAARGAQAIMVIGTSLTFFRGAAFNRALTERLSAETALPAATMSGAIVEGLETVGARNVAVVTAYSDEVNGWAGKDRDLQIGPRLLAFTSETFILSFSLPNFHFHATTAFIILRHNGVPLGKADFMGG